MAIMNILNIEDVHTEVIGPILTCAGTSGPAGLHCIQFEVYIAQLEWIRFISPHPYCAAVAPMGLLGSAPAKSGQPMVSLDCSLILFITAVALLPCAKIPDYMQVSFMLLRSFLIQVIFLYINTSGFFCCYHFFFLYECWDHKGSSVEWLAWIFLKWTCSF